MDDFEDVLRRAQAGDGRAAARIFRAYQPLILRYLRSQEARVADDLAGEVWLAAAAQLRDFRGDERGYRAWLFTVARRRVLEHRRRGIRRRTDIVDPLTFADTEVADRDPADQAVDSIDAGAAVDLIARVLSPEHAEVVILRTVADFTAGEVATLLGRTESWVRVTQHRALQRLAAHVRDEVPVTV
jgi:RNA polymerase sigma-70 factor (ECF subfamily)